MRWRGGGKEWKHHRTHLPAHSLALARAPTGTHARSPARLDRVRAHAHTHTHTHTCSHIHNSTHTHIHTYSTHTQTHTQVLERLIASSHVRKMLKGERSVEPIYTVGQVCFPPSDSVRPSLFLSAPLCLCPPLSVAPCACLSFHPVCLSVCLCVSPSLSHVNVARMSRCRKISLSCSMATLM